MNGTNQYFTPLGKLSDYIDPVTGACAGIIAFRATNASTSNLIGLIASEGNAWWIGVNNVGVTFSVNTSDGISTVGMEADTDNAVIVTLFRYDPTDNKMELSTDLGVSWSSSTLIWDIDSISPTSLGMWLGRDETRYLGGSLIDVRVTNYSISRSNLSTYGQLVAQRYGL